MFGARKGVACMLSGLASEHRTLLTMVCWLVLASAIAACGNNPLPQQPVPASWQRPSPPTSAAVPRGKWDAPANRWLSISSGSLGKVPVRTLLRSKATFEEAWNQAYSATTPAPRPPDVDFSEYMVLGLVAGPLADGGRIIVDSIGIVSGNVTAIVSTEQGCGPTEIVEHPVLFVAIPISNMPVRFLERQRPAPNCGG